MHRKLIAAAWLLLGTASAVPYSGSQCVGIIDFDLQLAGSAPALENQIAAAVSGLRCGVSVEREPMMTAAFLSRPADVDLVPADALDGDQLRRLAAHARLHAGVQRSRHDGPRLLQEQL